MTSTLANLAVASSASPLLSLVVKSTIALVFGIVAARAARRAAASVRHAILTAAFAATVMLPLASFSLPPVSIAVPIARAESIAPRSFAQPRMDRQLTPNTSQTERSMSISTTTLISILWAAGAIAFSLSFAAGVWRVSRIRRTALPWIEERATLDALATRAGIRRPVDLLLHEDVDVPITCGFGQPAVILPSDAHDWDRDALRRALVHELEHVRRRDWWTHLSARALCGLYWFNPLAWIAYRQLSLEAERACDDAVVQQEEGTEYAAQLVSLARRLSSRHARPTLAMANRSDLARRVSAVLNERQARGRAGFARTSLAGALAAMLACAVAPMRVIGAAENRFGGESQGARPRALSRINVALVEAAQAGDLDDVRSLLEAGAEVNAAVSGDGSPLIVAAREGHEELVTFLLQRGADPNMGVQGDGNPLIMAAREGHLNIVQLLLDSGATVDQVVPGDENALIQAAGEGRLDVVKLLVARGADVNARVWVGDGYPRRSGEWRTPLNMALGGNHRVVVEFLRSVGASQ